MGRSPVSEISKVVIVSKDITERKQAEKEIVETLQQLQETRDMLIQFEKHAAVGRLATGVAHEILNPAGIISSRLQFLEEENLSEPARENVRVSREQLQRIVKISHDLLQSSAKKPRVLVGGDLRRVIEVGLQMTERRREEDHVQVEYHPLPEVIPVKMETDRVVKVMVNLILNACDAMTGNQAKRLIVTIHPPEDSSKEHSVILTVADNGQGVPAGNLNRIFEPFFTTKAPGKGTGLGLSVSKGIIQEHGGTIRAENNDMGGASFIVELPLFDS
jgi:C4-dicarboxylate-specific signal transduction histidine kinase